MSAANPADAIFCNRCGVRLLNAGVTYRDRDSSSSVGMGQLLLGLGVLVLAGLVLGGGAIVLLGNSPRATPTHVAGGPTPSDQATLATSTPSGAATPTLFTLPPTPTLLATATPTVEPTVTPSPTPSPTAMPTPVDCAVASQGTNVKQWFLGRGHDTQKGPLPKTWCVRHVTIDQWSGWGTVALMNKNQTVYSATCLPTSCSPASQDFVPPHQVNSGKTLSYKYSCFDDPATADVNECADLSVVGAVITIDYEAFVGP